MSIEAIDIAWINGALVYYTPDSVYDYFLEDKGKLPGVPFTGDTPVASNIIEDTDSVRRIVDGAVVINRYTALVDQKWMPISRLFPSLTAFKTALYNALLKHANDLEARAIQDREWADSVWNIGTSVLGITPMVLDFQTEIIELTVEIGNSGNARLNWVATITPPSMASKITLDISEGAIMPAGDPVTLTITVDRTGVPVGDYFPQLSIVGDNETVIVELTVVVE